MSKQIELAKLRQIIMRLHKGLSYRQIAQDLLLNRKTIAKYGQIIEKQSNEDASSLLALPDTELANRFSINTAGPKLTVQQRRQMLLNQATYYKEELKRPGVTLQLLWQEYRNSADPDYYYSYASFCRILNTALKGSKGSYHKEYAPGEVLMIDFAGDKLSYTDKSTAKQIDCVVFVGVLGYSNYTYVEVLPSAKLPYLIQALNNNLLHIQGVPLFVLTDNMAQLVTRADRYEPTFTSAALSWANHNGTMLETARIAHPKDKSGVEAHVRIAYQRIYAPLRNQTFYSLKELGAAVSQKLREHNQKNFQGRTYSRLDQFTQEELPKLNPLPAQAFKMQKYTQAKVQKNYHVMLGEDKHFYSVPHDLVGKQVQLSYTVETVEIYFEMIRVAIHSRALQINGYSTFDDHMPESHKHYAKCKGFQRQDFLNMAAAVGDSTIKYITAMLDSRLYEQHAYNGCLGVLRLAKSKNYSPQRLEKACSIGLELTRYNYKTIATILETGADQRDNNTSAQPLVHENLRGPEAF